MFHSCWRKFGLVWLLVCMCVCSELNSDEVEHVEKKMLYVRWFLLVRFGVYYAMSQKTGFRLQKMLQIQFIRVAVLGKWFRISDEELKFFCVCVWLLLPLLKLMSVHCTVIKFETSRCALSDFIQNYFVRTSRSNRMVLHPRHRHHRHAIIFCVCLSFFVVLLAVAHAFGCNCLVYYTETDVNAMNVKFNIKIRVFFSSTLEWIKWHRALSNRLGDVRIEKAIPTFHQMHALCVFIQRIYRSTDTCYFFLRFLFHVHK